MQLQWVLLFLATAILASSCTTSQVDDPGSVSISELAKSNQEYLGKTVRVTGYATYEFENHNIWKNIRAERKHNCENGFGIDRGLIENFDNYNRSYVTIIGIVKPSCDGRALDNDDLICVSTAHCSDKIISIIEVMK